MSITGYERAFYRDMSMIAQSLHRLAQLQEYQMLTDRGNNLHGPMPEEMKDRWNELRSQLWPKKET